MTLFFDDLEDYAIFCSCCIKFASISNAIMNVPHPPLKYPVDSFFNFFKSFSASYTLIFAYSIASFAFFSLSKIF